MLSLCTGLRIRLERCQGRSVVCVMLVEDVDNDGMILKASKTKFMTRALSKLPKAIVAISRHVYRPWLFPIGRSARQTSKMRPRPPLARLCALTCLPRRGSARILRATSREGSHARSTLSPALIHTCTAHTREVCEEERHKKRLFRRHYRDGKSLHQRIYGSQLVS